MTLRTSRQRLGSALLIVLFMALPAGAQAVQPPAALAGVGTTVLAAAPTDGLIAYYSFVELSGSALDPISGNSGSFAPGTSRVAGLVGSGAANVAQNAALFSNDVSSQWPLSTGLSLAAIVLPRSVKPEKGRTVGPPVPVDGRPHYVVFTYDVATGLEAYWLDGKLTSTIVLAAGTPTALALNKTGCAVLSECPLGKVLTGVVDEVRVYSRALTAKEILSLAAVLSVPAFNAVPAITAADVVAVTGGIQLRITGSGFSPHAAVLLNGNPHGTIFVTDGELRSWITTTELQASTGLTVQVTNPAPGGGNSNQVPVPAHHRG